MLTPHCLPINLETYPPGVYNFEEPVSLLSVFGPSYFGMLNKIYHIVSDEKGITFRYRKSGDSVALTNATYSWKGLNTSGVTLYIMELVTNTKSFMLEES